MPGRKICTVFVFLLLLVGSKSCLAQKSYFDEIYQQLTQHIESGKYEENLSLYNIWGHHLPFQQLTCHQQGLLLHKIGVTYYNLDEERKAIEIFNDALDRWKNCPRAGNSDKANTVYNIGISYQYLNDLYLAGVYLDSAMILFESDPTYPRDQLAMKYYGVANFYNDGYDIYKAESNYRIALQFVQNVKEYNGLEFDILNALLTIKLNYHDYTGAMEVWNRALGVYKRDRSSIDRSALIQLYLNGGNGELNLNNFRIATEHVKQAIAMIDKEKDPYLYSIALEIRSMVFADQGHTLEANRLLDEVIKLRKHNLTSNEDYKALSNAYSNQAEQLGILGKFTEALEHITKAYHYLMFTPDFGAEDLPFAAKALVRDELQFVQAMDVHASILQEKFKKHLYLPDLEMALQLNFKMDTLLNMKMLAIQHEKSKVDFVNIVVSFYEKGIERALLLFAETDSPKYLHDAYYFCAKPKSIVLLSEMNEMEALAHFLTAEQERTKLSLIERLLNLRKSLSEDTLNHEQHLVAYIQALREWEKFHTLLERADSGYYQKKNALIVPLQLEQIRSRLVREAAHLEYFYGDSAIYIFCITNEGLVYDRISVDPTLEKAFNSFITECRNPDLPLDIQNANFLYGQLLEKCIRQMSVRISRIQIVPDGILFKLPFEALPVTFDKNVRYMVEAYDISYAYAAILTLPKPERKYAVPYTGFFTDYSAQLNGKLVEKGRLRAEERLAKLSISAREIEIGVELFNGEKYVYRGATKTNFMLGTADSRILHLSLHGLEDIQNPLNSSILFDDSEDDFVLTASDLYSQYLDADLVVLSTCHSGSGKIYGGEGVEGITKAFVLSGANTLLSSLWQAVEGSTFRIISSFYKNMKKGENLDTALANAKKTYLQEAEPHMRHPYYWAHFIVLGDISKNHTERIPFLLLIFIGFALLVLVFIGSRKIWHVVTHNV